MKIFSERLAQARINQRYSQGEIAKMIGMSLSGYQKIEYNQRGPKLEKLVKLAKILGVSADYLLGLKDR